MVRAPNWVGDAVMSLPALRVLRERYGRAEITVVSRPWVGDLYRREPSVDRVLPYSGSRWAMAARLRRECFDCAILFQNAFDAALLAWLARIPERIGYARDGRSLLLTRAVAVPEAGETPRHERFYYLELLRRAGLIERFPPCAEIRLPVPHTREAIVGISPGAAYGGAKRWAPDRFAESAARIARELGAKVIVFGSSGERQLAETVAQGVRQRGVEAHNAAGETSLGEFIDLAARCSVFLTNDSGAMHIASALGVPTVAVFGATDDVTTGPAGPRSRVVREHVECSPCLLRECPVDHRCMRRVTAERVSAEAMELLEECRAFG
jgi:heptosyltransferase-2